MSLAIGTDWWKHAPETAWLVRSLRASAKTLKHLTVQIDPSLSGWWSTSSLDRVAVTLASLGLALATCRLLGNATAHVAARLFPACPAETRAVGVRFGTVVNESTLEQLQALEGPVHELEVGVAANVSQVGLFLQAGLDAPALAGLRVLTVTSEFADTLSRLKSWGSVVKRAQAAGVAVRLLGRDHFKEQKMVFDG